MKDRYNVYPILLSVYCVNTKSKNAFFFLLVFLWMTRSLPEGRKSFRDSSSCGFYKETRDLLRLVFLEMDV